MSLERGRTDTCMRSPRGAKKPLMLPFHPHSLIPNSTLCIPVIMCQTASTICKPLNPNATPYTKAPSSVHPTKAITAEWLQQVIYLPTQPHPLSPPENWGYPHNQGAFVYQPRQPCPVHLYNTDVQPLPNKFAPYDGSKGEKERDSVTETVIEKGGTGDYGGISPLRGKRFATQKLIRGPRAYSKSRGKQWTPGSRKMMDRKGENVGDGVLGSHATECEGSLDGKTTVMIKNIPNQFRRGDLLRILNGHCRQENQKAALVSDPVRSEYDFLYLPMDFWTRLNKGYAFVNFTTAVGALRFSKVFHKLKWNSPPSKKICEITSAAIQGKEALKSHFKNSLFPCETNYYLPVVFSPPCDGLVRAKLTVIGRRTVRR